MHTYIYMYACVCVCMHACMHACVYAYGYFCTRKTYSKHAHIRVSYIRVRVSYPVDPTTLNPKA